MSQFSAVRSTPCSSVGFAKRSVSQPKVCRNARGGLLCGGQRTGGVAESATRLEGSSLQSRPDLDGVVFYTHTLCPYAQRVWLTLLEKGVDHTLVQIDLSNKPSWYYSVNPSGLVPAVEHAGDVIVESIDICRWIDQEFDGPSLMPADTEKSVMGNKLINACGQVTNAGFGVLSGSTARYWGIGTGASKSQVNQFESSLKRLDDSLQANGGPFLLGKDISIVDLIYMPFLERFALAMKKFSAYDLNHACNGTIGMWLNTMADRPACKNAAANPDLLLNAYTRHMSLDFFDYTTYEAFKLHPHLR